MSYDVNERSVQDGAPIELYEFRAPGYTPYRYTSAPVPITRQGFLFTPKAMNRSRLKVATHDSDDHYLEITLPANDPYIQTFGVQIAPPGLELLIYRYHAGDTPESALALWLGPVTAITISGDTATVRTSSAFGAILSGNLPSVYFQAPCNWTLYDAQCKVDRDLWSFTAEVVAVVANVVTLNAWDTDFDAVSFLGGEIVIPRNGERRMIAIRSAEDVTVSFPFSDMRIGDEVRLSAGCNHSFEDCRDKFNNAVEYGGDRFVPWINIFESGL